MISKRYDQDFGTFIVAASGQAVTFEPAARSIQVHSHEPRPDLPSQMPCQVLGGDCWTDGSSSAGDKLRRVWEQAGYDNQVVWDELTAWYVAKFEAPLAAARREFR